MRSIKSVAAGLCIGLLALFYTQPAWAIVINTTDFITNANRTNFNGFESIPSSISYGASYTEDSIKVEQVNGQLNDIWTTNLGWGAEGNRAWYPNGGDSGYTQITRADGSNFVDIGFLRGSGNSSHATLWYELLDDGASVLSGTVSHVVAGQYLGFSGGGFDQIRLRDGSPSITTSLYDGTHNALVIDSIELAGTTLPDPPPSPSSASASPDWAS